MPIEMTEHVCDEYIEESYESFDISESDLMKARPQPLPPTTSTPRFLDLPQRVTDERSMMEKINESFFNHENKVALNSDVDLIKTSKSAIKHELNVSNGSGEDKVSGN
jgi:hypothetical protein